jgi:hypothetical protein
MNTLLPPAALRDAHAVAEHASEYKKLWPHTLRPPTLWPFKNWQPIADVLPYQPNHFH